MGRRRFSELLRRAEYGWVHTRAYNESYCVNIFEIYLAYNFQAKVPALTSRSSGTEDFGQLARAVNHHVGWRFAQGVGRKTVGHATGPDAGIASGQHVVGRVTHH